MTAEGTIAARLLALGVFFAAAGAALAHADVAERAPIHRPLRDLSHDIAGWTGRDGPDFDDRVLKILGADEYVTRVYQKRSLPPVDLYVGYYRTQRAGDVIHSPLNCLPGAGWQPVESRRLRIATGSGDIDVNRLVVENGDERQLVLYWYQGRGRVIAGEYAGRLYLAFDAMRLHRTDGALVRIMTPLAAGERTADAAAAAFVRDLFPMLTPYIPS